MPAERKIIVPLSIRTSKDIYNAIDAIDAGINVKVVALKKGSKIKNGRKVPTLRIILNV